MASEWAILHGGALGDLVLTIQLALRVVDPGRVAGGRLHVISRTNPGDLSACVPSIVRTSSESIGLHWAYADSDAPPPAALRRVLSGRHVIAGFGEPGSPVLRRLSMLAPASLRSFEPAPQPGSFRHITEQWATQLEAQGLLAPKCLRRRGATSIRFPESLRTQGRAILAAASVAASPDEPVCVLHPGSGGLRKCWSLDAYIALARLLRTACSCALVVGPAEVDRGMAGELERRAPDTAVICCDDADKLTVLLAAADVFVGNDAGPTHLAALLGRPTIAIFGPTPHQVWRPLGPAVDVVVGRPREDSAAWRIAVRDIAARVLARLRGKAREATSTAVPDWGGAT